jgi:transcriptional regulator with GAF, ATPase, and Fis domain
MEEKLPAEQASLCNTILSSGLSLDQIEDMVLRESVARAHGNLAGAARLLGMTRPQLSYRLKRNQDHRTDKE